METTGAIALIADIVGILGAIAAVVAAIQARNIHQRLRLEEQRGNQRIKIILQNGEKTLELPAPIRRKDLSRAELLGRIGMIKPATRFQLESLNTQKFFDDLDTVVNSSDQMTLTISLTDSDYQQFVT